MDKILSRTEKIIGGLFKDNTTEADKYRFNNPGYKRLITYEDSEYWKNKNSLIKRPERSAAEHKERKERFEARSEAFNQP